MDGLKHLHSVPQSYINRMRDQHGINVTNPSTESSNLGIGIWGGKKKQRFSNDKVIEKGRDIFNMIKSGTYKSSDDTSIFTGAHTRLFGAKPQSTMEQLQKFMDSENGVISWFDMETLGSLDGKGSDIFTPTEVYFEQHAFKNHAKEYVNRDGKIEQLNMGGKYSFDNVGRKGFLVKPHKDVEQNLKSLIQDVQTGKKQSLTEAESRTLADLIKYSDGVQIDNTSQGSIVTAHSSNYQQYTKGKMINMHNNTAINKAQEGLNTLINSGESPKEIANQMHNFVMNEVTDPNTNKFVAGHNIKNFDFRAMNKYFNQFGLDEIEAPNYIDTYQMNLSMFPSPMAMQDLNNLSPEAIIKNKGTFQLESLTKLHADETTDLGPFKAHVAFNDTKANAKYFENIMSNSENVDYIKTNFMRHGGSGLHDTSDFHFNMEELKSGDELFSVKGMSAWNKKSQGSFVTKIIDGEEVMAQDAYVLPSHRKFEVVDMYEKDGLFGLELYNPVDDQHHYINKESKDDLAKTVFEQFKPATAFGEEEMQTMDEYVRKDLSRSKYRKLTRTTSSGGFMGLKKLHQAYAEEQEIIESGGDLAKFKEERLPEIFSYQKEGKRVALGSYSTYYGDLKGRLGKDHAFMKDLINQVDDAFPEDHVTGNDVWGLRRKKHAAVVTAYQDYIGDVGGDTVLEKVPETKAFSVSLSHPMGGKSTIPLSSQDQTTSYLNYLLKGVSPTGDRQPAQKRQFLKETVDTLEKKTSAFFTEGKSLYKAKELYQEGRHNEASQQVMSFLNQTKQHLPKGLDAETKLSQLNKSPKNVEKVADDLIKTLGLDQFDLNDPEALKEFQKDLRFVKEYADTQESTNYMSTEMSRVLHKHKEKVPGMHQPYQEILNLDEGPSGDPNVKHNKYIKKGIEKARTLHEVNTKGGVSIGSSHQVGKQLKMLDDNLKTIYKQFGFDENKMPTTMSHDLDKFLGSIKDSAKGKGVSFKLGMLGDNKSSKLILSAFDSGSYDSMMGKTTQELMQDGSKAVNIEIPLINMDREIGFGGVKKLSPLAIIEREFQDKYGRPSLDPSRPGGNIKAKTAFSKVLENLDRNMGSIIKDVSDGEHLKAEGKASKRILESLENLTGGNQYGETVDYESTGRAADFFKKNSIVFNGLFEDGEGNWYDFLSGDLDDQGRLEKLGIDGKYNLLKERQNELQGVINSALGDNITLNVAGTRGKQLAKGMASVLNVQDYFGMGYYNNPARDSMIQAFQVNKFTDGSIKAFSNLAKKTGGDVSLNPFLVSEGQAFMSGLKQGYKFEDAVMGVQAKTAVMDEETMLNKFISTVEQMESEGFDVSKEKALLKDPAKLPSLFENQALVSEDFIGAYESHREKPFSFAAHEDAELLPHVKKQIKEKGEYEVGYMKPFATKLNADGERVEVLNQYKSKHSILGEKKKKGKLVLNMREEFGPREGITKLMFGQEKFTVRNVLSREVMDRAFGENVSAVIQPDFAKHEAYGDVLSGAFKDTMRQIHSLEVEQEVKKQKINKVSEIITNLTGMGTSVKEQDGQFYIEYSGNDRLPQLSWDAQTAQRVAKGDGFNVKGSELIGLKDVMNQLEDIDKNIHLDDDILTLEARIVKNEENIHYKSLSGQVMHGKHGMRATPRQIDMLKNKRYHHTAEYLKETIIDGYDPDIHKQLMGDYKALEHLDYVSQKGDKFAKTFDEDVVDYRNFVDKYYGKHPKGTFVQSGEGIEFLKGKTRAEDIKGSILDPDRGEFYLDLPEEVTIQTKKEHGIQKADYTNVQRMFMTSAKKNTTSDGYHVVGDMEFQQSKILQDLHDYNMAKYKSDQWFGEDGMSQKLYGKEVGLGDIKQRLQDDVQGYYDTALKDLTTSKGKFMKNIASGRIAGSSGGNIQIMSPYMAEVAKKRQEGLAEADHLGITEKFGTEIPEDPNTIHISKKRAQQLVKGVDEKEANALMKQMQNKGALGHATRFPVIHPGSTMPVKYKVSENLDEDTVRITSELAKAMNADSDGDSMFYSLFHGKDSEFYVGKQFNHTDIEEDFAKASMQLQEIKKDVAENYRLQISEGYEKSTKETDYGIGIIKNLQDDVVDVMRSNQVGNEVISEKLITEKHNMIAASKLKNQMYTGMVNNVIDQFRQVGVENLMDDEESTKSFLEAMGIMIEEPISAKHLGSGKDVMGVDASQDISPTAVTSALRKGQLGVIKRMDFLNERQYTALEKGLGSMTDDQRYDLSQKIGLSQQVYSKGVTPFVQAVNKSTQSPTTANEIFGEEIQGNLSGRLVETYNNAEKAQSGMGQSEREVLDKQAQGLGAALSKQASTVKNIAPGGFSKFALGTAVAGGFAMGEFMGAGDPLPMDSSNDPALQPVGDNAPRTINTEVQNAEGMMNLMEDQGDQQYFNNISQIMQEENIKMTISGKTTKDRDPEELSRLATEEIMDTMEFPINMNFNMNDNRNNISDSWIENQIVRSIRR